MSQQQICPACGCAITTPYEKGGVAYCCEPCATGSPCQCGCCHPVTKGTAKKPGKTKK